MGLESTSLVVVSPLTVGGAGNGVVTGGDSPAVGCGAGTGWDCSAGCAVVTGVIAVTGGSGAIVVTGGCGADAD